MNKAAIILLLLATAAEAQMSYPPAADMEGSTAIHKSSTAFTGWATGVEVVRGYVQISDPTIAHNGSNKATYGTPEDAIGIPDVGAVSLGDAGTATVTFAQPIANGEGYDFAVFENGTDTFLELAFVEVSSDGVNFFRFPAVSETQTVTPVGGFGALEARNLNNLAGKYRVDYGTPFNLDDVPNDPLLNKARITHVKLVDVVGSLEMPYATYDSNGNAINDPFPTPYYSSGFDLTGVGVINQASLSIADNDLIQFSLYPNPAEDVVTISIAEPMVRGVTIYDISGRKVLAQQINNSVVVQVSQLTPGIYTVVLNDEGKTTSKRLVIK